MYCIAFVNNFNQAEYWTGSRKLFTLAKVDAHKYATYKQAKLSYQRLTEQHTKQLLKLKDTRNLDIVSSLQILETA